VCFEFGVEERGVMDGESGNKEAREPR